ncbi:hypothetical protein [Pontivivens ytuae]|nr:hypothetical protein [Pontivivens ytuae]
MLFYGMSVLFFFLIWLFVEFAGWIQSAPVDSNDTTGMRLVSYVEDTLFAIMLTYIVGSLGALARVTFDDTINAEEQENEKLQAIYGRLGTGGMFGIFGFFLVELGLLELLIFGNDASLADLSPSPAGIIIVSFLSGLFTSEVFTGLHRRVQRGNETQSSTSTTSNPATRPGSDTAAGSGDDTKD